MPPRYARAGHLDHAVFEHEYDSLSDEEKRIFIRLLECDDQIYLTG